ncbi:MAG: GNAT family N-acetyltransferase [Thermoguttaceae bacterium]|nr:GNAT family N-acetyltransferase [Thermoguttaceae bacterium]
MDIRRFNNTNTALREKYLSFWGQTLDPAFYEALDDAALRRAERPTDRFDASRAADRALNETFTHWKLFKTEALNNYFVEPSASFWAVDAAPSPLGCVLSALAPNVDELDGADAALYGPFFSTGVADDERPSVARTLIEAAENALRDKGVRRAFAGGAPPRVSEVGRAPTGAPLMNGIYGFGSPVGFFDSDPTRQFFVDAGYEAERDERGGERAFVERRIDAEMFLPSDEELAPGWRLTRESRRSANWRAASIGRNFSNSRQFCVRGLDSTLLAIAWTYDLLKPGSTPGEYRVQRVVSRLTTRKEYRGRRLASALVAALVEDAKTNRREAPGRDVEICAVVSATDEAARGFWNAQGFGVGRRSTPLVKTL